MVSTMQQFATENIVDCFLNRGNKCSGLDFEFDGEYWFDRYRSWIKEEYPACHGKRVDLFVNAIYKDGKKEIEESYAFEIKSCKADLNSGCGLNFVGKRNFIVVPEFGWDKSFAEAYHKLAEIDRGDVGILTIDKRGTICCWRSSGLWENKVKGYGFTNVIGRYLTRGFGDVYEGIII